jgi:thioredoxin 1
MSKNVNEVRESEFEQNVIRSQQPVLVDFWATWCPPCRAIAPSVEAVAQEYANRARVVKVNVDDNPELASRYKIKGIPTLVLIKRGEEQDRIVGAAPKEEIARLIERHLV